MDNYILESVRKRLVEYEEESQGCLMLKVNITPESWSQLQSMISEDDISGADGRQNEPHVTILCSIKADVSSKMIEAYVNRMKPPTIILDKVTCFHHENIDVLKFDVVSDDLHMMNEICEEIPNDYDFSQYKPHLTIAYLKPNTGDKYYGKLKSPIKARPNVIVFSEPNGDKKFYKIA